MTTPDFATVTDHMYATSGQVAAAGTSLDGAYGPIPAAVVQCVTGNGGVPCLSRTLTELLSVVARDAISRTADDMQDLSTQIRKAADDMDAAKRDLAQRNAAVAPGQVVA